MYNSSELISLQRHLRSYHPTMRMEAIDNGVALLQGEKIIGVAATPLKVHKKYLLEREERMAAKTRTAKNEPLVPPPPPPPEAETQIIEHKRTYGPPALEYVPPLKVANLPRVNMEFNQETITTRIEANLDEWLRRKARLTRRSRSQTILFALLECMGSPGFFERAEPLASASFNGVKMVKATVYLGVRGERIGQRIPKGLLAASLQLALRMQREEEGS